MTIEIQLFPGKKEMPDEDHFKTFKEALKDPEGTAALAVMPDQQLWRVWKKADRFSNLRVLDISRCKLKEVPEAIGQMTGLESLNLSETQITEAPAVLGQLTNLRELDLSGHEGLKYAPELAQLTNLEALNLSSRLLVCECEAPWQSGESRV